MLVRVLRLVLVVLWVRLLVCSVVCICVVSGVSVLCLCCR